MGKKNKQIEFSKIVTTTFNMVIGDIDIKALKDVVKTLKNHNKMDCLKSVGFNDCRLCNYIFPCYKNRCCPDYSYDNEEIISKLEKFIKEVEKEIDIEYRKPLEVEFKDVDGFDNDMILMRIKHQSKEVYEYFSDNLNFTCNKVILYSEVMPDIDNVRDTIRLYIRGNNVNYDDKVLIFDRKYKNIIVDVIDTFNDFLHRRMI